VTASSLAAPPALATAPARPATTLSGAGERRPSWREETGLVLTVVGAMVIVFVPASVIVSNASPEALTSFAAVMAVSWTVCVILQVTVLRVVRSGPRGRPLPLWLQYLAVAVLGCVYKVTVDGVSGRFAEAAGLGTDDSWRFAVSAWISALVALYLVWEREGRARHDAAARRLADVQQAQLRARRAIVDSQLRAVQARVDPQFFFDILDAIEAFYRHDVARAEALFDELIVFLRAALPHVDGASSMLARELEIAASCVRIASLMTGRECRLDVDVPVDLMRLPFPAGVLLPLLQGALDAAPAAGAIVAEVRARLDSEGGCSSVVLLVAAPAAPAASVCASVRESLYALFGGSASLACEQRDAARVDTTVVLPHDEP
jgi:hypothetical protein